MMQNRPKTILSDDTMKKPSHVSVVSKLLKQFLSTMVITVLSIGGCYAMVTRAPLHLIYEGIPHAGPGSVYVQGGAFSGFWFQLGLLQSIPSLQDHQYYCYSSGCLSLIVTFLQLSLEDTFQLALGAQEAWLQGDITLHDVVEYFVDDVMRTNETSVGRAHEVILQNLNVLVTTPEEGVVVRRASTIEELKQLIIQTTYIPLLTGSSLWHTDHNGTIYLDGGFSMMLHPECEYTVSVPSTPDIWLYAFIPTFGFNTAQKFWKDGQQFNHPLKALNPFEISHLETSPLELECNNTF